MSKEAPSAYIATSLIRDEVPAGKMRGAGVTAMVCNAPVTSKFVKAVWEARVAVIVQLPTAIPFARPAAPLILLMEATERFRHCQTTDEVRSWVLPSA